MRYAFLGACVLVGLCGYFIGQTYYARGKADCERAQTVANQQTMATVQRVQTTVARNAVITGVADIRRMLREQYTIAD